MKEILGICKNYPVIGAMKGLSEAILPMHLAGIVRFTESSKKCGYTSQKGCSVKVSDKEVRLSMLCSACNDLIQWLLPQLRFPPKLPTRLSYVIM